MGISITTLTDQFGGLQEIVNILDSKKWSCYPWRSITIVHCLSFCHCGHCPPETHGVIPPPTKHHTRCTALLPRSLRGRPVQVPWLFCMTLSLSAEDCFLMSRNLTWETVAVPEKESLAVSASFLWPNHSLADPKKCEKVREKKGETAKGPCPGQCGKTEPPLLSRRCESAANVATINGRAEAVLKSNDFTGKLNWDSAGVLLLSALG